jgi:hypothetical protein
MPPRTAEASPALLLLRGRAVRAGGSLRWFDRTNLARLRRGVSAMPESPIGSIIAFGGSHPSDAWEQQNGWLHCDGRLLDRNETDGFGYPYWDDLFNVIRFAEVDCHK